MAVFSLMILAMLLGMVLNVGLEADSKVKMQNAADASAYSSGVVLARGMNGLAFTNHLLFDVFSLTAFLREGAENHGAPMVPEILAAWNEVAPTFDFDGFDKFQNWNGNYVGQSFSFATPKLSDAIQNKVPLEQAMVDTFSAWAATFSTNILPSLEAILDGELIPEYQRALVATIPNLAQRLANDVAQAHGLTAQGVFDSARGPLQGQLWSAQATPVGGDWESQVQTLPVVDPLFTNSSDQDYYLKLARMQREHRARLYLRHWNFEKLAPFWNIGRMSQFFSLWNGFTRGQLVKLLKENEFRNLPHIIETPPDVIQAATASGQNILRITVEDIYKFYPATERNHFLNQRYSFVTALYWPKMSRSLPGLFDTPVVGDHITFTQIQLFIPRKRLVWVKKGRWPDGRTDPCFMNGDRRVGEAGWIRGPRGQSTNWDLLNQSWRVQVVPATHPNLLAILQTPPVLDGSAGQPDQEVTLPDLSNLSNDDLLMLNHH